MESARYAAALETGEGFVAFAGGYLITPAPHLEVGEVNLPEGRILPDGHEIFPWPKVRRMAPMEGEFVYIVEDEVPNMVMATDLGDDTMLVVTDSAVADAIWGGKVLEFVFDRAAYVEVNVAS